MIKDTKLHTAIQEYISAERHALNEKVSKFLLDMVESPTYALRWADSVFVAQSKLNALNKLQNYLNTQTLYTMDDIISSFTHRIVEDATYSSNSTSVCANLMESCEVKGLGNVLDDLKYID